MGLNDFVSLFYGSAQNLNTSSPSLASSSSADVEIPLINTKNTSTTLEMLKNHKNSKLPKFNLNEFSTGDVKFSRNMTLTSLKTPRQKGIILSDNCRGSGGGGVGSGGMSSKGGEKSDTTSVSAVGSGKSGRNVKNVSTSAIHKLHSSSSTAAAKSTSTALDAVSTTSTSFSAAAASRCTSTSTSSSAVIQTCSSEMDLLKAGPGLRKKSSFLWNSFRMPRKQKGGESRD